MADVDQKKEERLMKAIIMFAFASFLFFFFVTISGMEPIVRMIVSDSDPYLATRPAVLGVEDNVVYQVEGEGVELLLNNARLGEAVLEFDISGSEPISGAELYFDITDTLAIDGVICSSQFECLEVMSEGKLQLRMFRPPDLADQPLFGKVPVATIVYDQSTYGELVINVEGQPVSKIVKLGSDENLLDLEPVYLQAGVKPALY